MRDNLLKTLLKDTFAYGFSDIVIKLIAFFTFPIMASLLLVSEYGSLSLITSVTAIIGLFMNMGIDNSVQRFYFENKDNKLLQDTLVSTSFYTLLISSVIFSILFLLILLLFNDTITNALNASTFVVVIAALHNFPMLIIGFSKNMIRLYFEPIKFIILTIIFSLGGIFLGIYFVTKGQGLFGYFAAQILVGILLIPIAIFFFRKNLVIRFDFFVFKEIIRYGYPFVLAGVGYLLFTSVDKWCLRYFIGVESVGLYSVGMKFSTLVYFFQSAFAQAWSPLALKHVSDNPQNYKMSFSTVLNVFFSFMVVLGATTFFFAPDFVRLFLPISYIGSIPVIMFLISAVVIYSTTQVTLIGISLAKKTYLMNHAVWISVIVNSLLNILLIPIFKEEGAALASFITYLALSLLYLYYGQKVHYIPFNYKKLLKIFLLLIVLMIISSVFQKTEWFLWHVILKIFIIIMSILYLFISKTLSIHDFLKVIRNK